MRHIIVYGDRIEGLSWRFKLEMKLHRISEKDILDAFWNQRGNILAKWLTDLASAEISK